MDIKDDYFDDRLEDIVGKTIVEHDEDEDAKTFNSHGPTIITT